MTEQRKLAAVMFTDIAGYTALMSKDEQKALALLKKNREMQQSLAEKHHGEFLKEMGDGTLLCFQSALDAVRCALEIQKSVKDDPDLNLRIGIHLGDIIFKDRDVFGDGVNVASRIEALAKEGGIYITGQVYNTIRNKPDIKAIFMGEKLLKNINNPVNIYSLLSEPFSERQNDLGTTSPNKTKGKSIAVLPFTDMSPEKNQEYFCEGMAEELIDALTKVVGLRVASRTSAFQFKEKGYDISEVGKKLNVQSILEGSIRKAGVKLRITAQLVDVSNGYHIWSEKYDREMEDIFTIQDEISVAIVDNLKVKLFKEEKIKLIKRYTDDSEAYDLYLKGRYFWIRRYEGGLQKGLEYFNQTVKKDPSYAPAYAGIADSLSVLGLLGWLPPKEAFPKAKENALKALDIDDMLAEAYTSLGWINYLYDWDWIVAEKTLKRALEIDPQYAIGHFFYALFLTWMSRFEEATAEIMKALEVEPLSLLLNVTLGLIFYFKRQYDEAIEQCLKTLEMETNYLLSNFYLGAGYMGKGMLKETISAFEKAVALSGESPYFLGFLGCAYAMSGQKVKARKILHQLYEISKKRYVSFYYRALIYWGLGDKDQLFKCFERAYMDREPLLVFIKSFPLFVSIHSEPRFSDLLKKIGLE